MYVYLYVVRDGAHGEFRLQHAASGSSACSSLDETAGSNAALSQGDRGPRKLAAAKVESVESGHPAGRDRARAARKEKGSEEVGGN